MGSAIDILHVVLHELISHVSIYDELLLEKSEQGDATLDT
jgi:hypothetical protein